MQTEQLLAILLLVLSSNTGQGYQSVVSTNKKNILLLCFLINHIFGALLEP
jgi:hypothetical protein